MIEADHRAAVELELALRGRCTGDVRGRAELEVALRAAVAREDAGIAAGARALRGVVAREVELIARIGLARRRIRAIDSARTIAARGLAVRSRGARALARLLIDRARAGAPGAGAGRSSAAATARRRQPETHEPCESHLPIVTRARAEISKNRRRTRQAHTGSLPCPRRRR